MRDDLRDQIQQEKQTCERTLQSIQDARKLTQGQAAERAAELKVPLQRLSQIQKSVEALARTTVEEGDGTDYGSFADE
jgi:flagellar motility protein MotE (MotC chaperone)